MFDAMWPIGSVYISVNARSAPFQNIPNCRSTWVQLSTGRTLWNVETTDQLDNTLAEGSEPKIEPGLPEIYGTHHSAHGYYPFSIEPNGSRGAFTNYLGSDEEIHLTNSKLTNLIARDFIIKALQNAADDVDKANFNKMDWQVPDSNFGGGLQEFHASKSNPIYGNSTVVQPASIKTTMWKRIA